MDRCAFERQLDNGNAWALYSYEDAQCEFPERLVVEWLAESVEAGAIVCNHTQLLEITRSNGRVTGARLRDRISAQEYPIQAAHIINPPRPRADAVLGAPRLPTPPWSVGERA